ncbi:MAG: ribosome-binding factor A, partial [Planctomycetia bacterium]|nr:ribosome-binding factor A [Planctomycetia bacterium]
MLCTQTGPEDGIDPRYLRRDPTGQRGGRKTLQLCKQVERALGLVLAAECGDPVLQGLQVIAVEPAPSSARLLITVCPAPEHDGEG